MEPATIIPVNLSDKHIWNVKLSLKKAISNAYYVKFEGDSFTNHLFEWNGNRISIIDGVVNVYFSFKSINTRVFMSEFNVEVGERRKRMITIEEETAGIFIRPSTRLSLLLEFEYLRDEFINNILLNSPELPDETSFHFLDTRGFSINIKDIDEGLLVWLGRMFHCMAGYQPKINPDELIIQYPSQ